MTDDSAAVGAEAYEARAGTPAKLPATPARDGAIETLRIFAWLDLVGGIVAAIVIWIKFGSVEVAGFAGLGESQANPVGIGLGIALLMQGVFLCAYFLVIAGAAEDIAAIRKKGGA